MDSDKFAERIRCMFSQSQIKRTLSQPVAISYAAELLDSGDFIQRGKLADLLRAEWGFQGARGDPGAGCVKAPRELEAAGFFTLPEVQGNTVPGTPKREKFADWQ